MEPIRCPLIEGHQCTSFGCRLSIEYPCLLSAEHYADTFLFIEKLALNPEMEIDLNKETARTEIQMESSAKALEIDSEKFKERVYLEVERKRNLKI